MKKRKEKSFHIRLNLEKATDRDIWEWLKAKEDSQTISINAFVIEGLRKLKLAEIRADAGTVIMPVTEMKHDSERELSPGAMREVPAYGKTKPETDGQEQMGLPLPEALSEEAMDFLDSF